MNEIKVVDEFMAQWKERATKWYNDMLVKHVELKTASSDAYNAQPDDVKRFGKGKTEEYAAAFDKLAAFEKGIGTSAYNNLYWMEYYNQQKAVYAKMGKDSSALVTAEQFLSDKLDKEIVRKKLTLIARMKDKVGTIEDASFLSIGVNGEINGFVKGDKGKAEVRTIYAGGYNIKCLHYRVLVLMAKK